MGSEKVLFSVMVSAQSDQEFLAETARWMADNDTRLAEALPALYDELRRLAAGYLRNERADHTLQPTALVHEAYLRLREQRTVDWSNHSHFVGVAARMMRRILVKHAETRNAAKRRGTSVHLNLDDALEVFDAEAMPALEVNRALDDLEALDARQAQIAELRFFGGLTLEETANVLGISPATVKREWSVARLWLEREIGKG
jgi:RNA polymerase sigma-70 factor, ECF subfamily